MKPQPLKLAGMVVLMFGGVTSFGVGAIEQDVPTVTEGRVMTPADVSAAPAATTPDGGQATPATNTEPALSAAPIAAPPPAQDTDAADSDPAWSSAGTVALSSEQLDNMRGGFDLPSGLKVSFGVQQVAFVNGNMVSTTNFNIPDVSAMTSQQAQALASANTSGLVQVGHGNTVQPGALPGLTGGVIQNTLSNQQIQALTTINTSVNSLGTFKTMNVGSTINGALMNAVRPR